MSGSRKFWLWFAALIPLAFLIGGCSQGSEFAFVNVGQTKLHLRFYDSSDQGTIAEADIAPGACAYAMALYSGKGTIDVTDSAGRKNTVAMDPIHDQHRLEENLSYVFPLDGSGKIYDAARM